MKKFMERGEALGHEYPEKERILAELKPGKGSMNLDLLSLTQKQNKTGQPALKLSGRRVSPYEPAAGKSFISNSTQ